jgi:hypothetical protein
MDTIIYAGSQFLCEALKSVGANQLAYEMGYKGLTIIGTPAVACGPQPSSYFWGIAVWVFVGGGIATILKRVHDKSSPSDSSRESGAKTE